EGGAGEGGAALAEVRPGPLLPRAYNDGRRRLVAPARASLALRPGCGRLPGGWPFVDPAFARAAPAEPQALAAARGRSDTTQCVAVDRHGNCVSATPSGGRIPTPPLGPRPRLPVGTRGQMVVLDREHPD